MKHLKKFEAIDHSDIDPFNEENWDDYSKLLEDNGYVFVGKTGKKKVFQSKQSSIQLIITDNKLFDFKFSFNIKEKNGNINSIFGISIRVYEIDKKTLSNVEKEFMKILKNSEKV